MNDPDALLSRLLTETLISFSQAARLIPPSRKGRPVTPSCIWRWHTAGVRTADGRIVHLEAALLVRRFVTSVEAIRRFIAAQQPVQNTNHESSGDGPATPSRTPRQVPKRSEKARQKLAEIQGRGR